MARAPKIAGPKNLEEAFLQLSTKLKAQASKPNLYGYKPHDKQVAFHSAQSKGRLYIGGNRAGKTVANIIECIYWLTGNHPYRVTPPPPVAGRIVSVDFINGIEKIIKPELARWLPPSMLKGGSWSTAYSKELRTLTLENGSFVELMSYDQDLDKFSGTSRDFVSFDEEPPQDLWLENKTRLIDRGGSYWISMTPVEGMSWVFDDIYMAGKASATSGISVIEVDMTENPYLLSGEIDEFVSGLSADDKNARVHGKFVQLGGLVFKEFDTNIHVIDPIIPSKDWEWYASMDHGYNNPTAWLWHAVSPDERVITFAEHYVPGEIIAKHAESVHQKNEQNGRPPDIYVGDPSIVQHNGVTGTSVQLEYQMGGVPITLGNNDVLVGINRMARYLEIRGDNKPSWLITRNCTNLIYEMQRYRWKTYANKRIGRDNNAREAPHKKDDHAIDSCKYFFNARPELGPNRYVPNKISNPLGMPEVHRQRIDFDRFAGQERMQNETKWRIESQDEFLGMEF